jgi:hypothetical protein
MHEHIFAVLARNEAEAFRVIEPLHSTLFHLVRISCIELRRMNRSDNSQNLAWLGELLHTTGSSQTLETVYHRCQKWAQDFFPIVSISDFQFRKLMTTLDLASTLRV